MFIIGRYDEREIAFQLEYLSISDLNKLFNYLCLCLNNIRIINEPPVK